MSQIFAARDRARTGFENQLRLAFRGDAKEQREASDNFLRLSGLAKLGNFGPNRTARQVSGSNVFKSNLGGTNR